jgi:hypothetical protein
MTDPPMFLEYDRTFNAFRSHLGGAFTSHYFETLTAARHDLRLIGLRLGAKTDPGTWRIEFIEPVAEPAKDQFDRRPSSDAARVSAHLFFR